MKEVKAGKKLIKMAPWIWSYLNNMYSRPNLIVNLLMRNVVICLSCVRVCVRVFQNSCMMKIPFFPPLISGLEASWGSLASGLRELTKGPHSFFSSRINLGVDTISALILRIYL